jgi:hypothetical protein
MNAFTHPSGTDQCVYKHRLSQIARPVAGLMEGVFWLSRVGCASGGAKSERILARAGA